jgi:hypothetical protein
MQLQPAECKIEERERKAEKNFHRFYVVFLEQGDQIERLFYLDRLSNSTE